MTQPFSAPRRSRTSFGEALQRRASELELVEQTMREQLGSVSDLVERVGEHVLSSGGKRFRPALVLFAAELCGYRGPRAILIAAAVELLHNATLLHDDVVDVSPLRRGKPTANALWGNRRAILAGDFLYARASSMIVEDGNIDILWIFADTIRRMSEGELLQLERSYDPTVTEALYYSVIEMKSAVLLGTATESGAILGGVTRAERRRLADFGREIGLAFQLRDDALDYEAREAATGKRPYADVREGKVTLPLMLTLKRCTSSERERIAAVLKSAARLNDLGLAAGDRAAAAELESLDLTPVVELVERYHGIADTVRRAGEHVARAASAIAAFPEGRAKNDLLAAAEYCVSRDR